MALPVYVINLDRRPDRMATIKAHLDQLGLAFERIPAVDVHTLEDDGSVQRPPFLDLGARACLLSHQRALGRFLASSHPAALVIEDDKGCGDSCRN